MPTKTDSVGTIGKTTRSVVSTQTRPGFGPVERPHPFSLVNPSHPRPSPLRRYSLMLGIVHCRHVFNSVKPQFWGIANSGLHGVFRGRVPVRTYVLDRSVCPPLRRMGVHVWARGCVCRFSSPGVMRPETPKSFLSDFHALPRGIYPCRGFRGLERRTGPLSM